MNREHEFHNQSLTYNLYEIVFDAYAMGWVLDELASVGEHGWSVHTENLWSFLDLSFVVIFCIYFGVRMHGFSSQDPSYAKLASDIIAMAAPVLLPRLAFCVMPENMLLISLRTMMADFTFLTLLACWCFGGFLFAMWYVSPRSTTI